MLAELLTLPYSVAVSSAVLVYPLPSTTPVYAEADISLVLEESDGSVGFTPVLNTDYTVAIDASNVATITFLANTELTTGRVLVVDRETERSQPVQFSELEDLPGAAIEKQDDRQVAMIQENTAKLARAILARRGETVPTFPAKSSLLGQLFYLNATGDAWSTLDAASTKTVADDLALGGASKIAIAAGLNDEIQVLAGLAVELAALGAIPTELASLYNSLSQLLVVYGAINDGTIGDLLDGQVGGQSTLAALQAYTSASNGQIMRLAGRTVIGDDGGGFFVYNTADLSSTLINDTKAIASGDINTGTDVLTETGHGLYTGEACIVDGGDGPTANTIIYYISRIDDDTFYLYDTFGNALAAGATGRIDFTGTTAFNVKTLIDPRQAVYVISNGDALDGSQGAWVRHDRSYPRPEWFDAVGDNSTDDTAAFQAGFYYLGYVGGGMLNMGPKAYYCAETVIPRENNVGMEGISMEVSKFRTGKGDADGIRFARSEVGRTYFRYGRLAHFTIEYTGTDPTAGALLRLERAREFRVENVKTVGGYNGITVTSPGIDTIIKDCICVYQNFTARPSGTSAGILITRQQTDSGDANAVQDSVDSLYYALGYSAKLTNVEVWGDPSSTWGWEYGVLVHHIDGLQIDGCHFGRCEQAQLAFQALQSNMLCQNVSVSNTEFDPAPEVTQLGNRGVMYLTDGLGSRLVRGHKYSNCSILGADSSGFFVQEDVDDIMWSGGITKNCDEWSFRINAGTNIVIDGAMSTDPDQGSTGAGHILVAGGDQIHVSGLIGHGTGLTAGVSVTGGTNVTVKKCSVSGSSDPYAFAIGAIRAANDNDSDRSRSIASAQVLDVPPEHKTVYVTGTTTIEGIAQNDSWEGRTLELIFDNSVTITNNVAPTGGRKFRLTGNKSATVRNTLTVTHYNNIWYETGYVNVA